MKVGRDILPLLKRSRFSMQLAQQFGITALLDRRFKYLSTGETRKTLLCQALMSEPDLLILDES
ncbi:ATP-binding cassette domain-containing protein, partial [Shigella sonnei]|uniref:ATP-binding cassette domain-containing protein n=1 Tax=Shigella sonnei TaxID=624 RepID=UPI003F496C08